MGCGGGGLCLPRAGGDRCAPLPLLEGPPASCPLCSAACQCASSGNGLRCCCCVRPACSCCCAGRGCSRGTCTVACDQRRRCCHPPHAPPGPRRACAPMLRYVDCDGRPPAPGHDALCARRSGDPVRCCCCCFARLRRRRRRRRKGRPVVRPSTAVHHGGGRRGERAGEPLLLLGCSVISRL